MALHSSERRLRSTTTLLTLLSLCPRLSAAGRGVRSLQRKSRKVHWTHRTATHATRPLSDTFILTARAHIHPHGTHSDGGSPDVNCMQPTGTDRCQVVRFPLAIPPHNTVEFTHSSEPLQSHAPSNSTANQSAALIQGLRGVPNHLQDVPHQTHSKLQFARFSI